MYNLWLICLYIADGSDFGGNVGLIVHNSITWLHGMRSLGWLTLAPDRGTIEAWSSQTLSVSLDINRLDALRPGNYYAQLLIEHNTPYAPIYIPITMTVDIPANWGKLAGVVSSLDFCKSRPTPLVGAQVMVESRQDGRRWELTTDISGTYTLWMDVSHSPLNLTVSRRGHGTQELTNVALTAQHVITRDIELQEDPRLCPPATVTMRGAYIGLPNRPYTFTVAAEPLPFTELITYSWQTTEQSPIKHTNRVTDSVVYTWRRQGAKTIQIEADNGASETTKITRRIVIMDAIRLYLPFVRR